MKLGQGIATPLELDTAMNFYEIGAEFTIGGADYGPAIASYNGYADASTVIGAGEQIEIPESWLGVAVMGTKKTPAQSFASASPLLLLVGFGLLLFANG